ncbi:germ cell nuclear acidic protein [Pristis pectinata]|uniref:germ cell nuclear acidic protein n=1 Tax=Pristis pectinata TaxID=685728 RepID=UPI00223E7C6A|nr:germ cell nuclear acidic protein [Pristis pectinata]
MDETCSLFQRLADRLGWSKYDDLDILETELQQKIDKSKQQDYGKDISVNLPSESGESPNTCDSCVCKLLLSSSEDEAESCSKVSLDNRQKEHGKCTATKKMFETPQIHSGSEAISDSNADNFENFLTHKTLNSDFNARGASRIWNKRSDHTPVWSSDSSGDEDFEKFLTSVKKPCSKSQKYRTSKKNDDGLKDFIVSDSSLDELHIKEIVEPECDADTELHEPIWPSHKPGTKSTMEQVCSTSSVARSMSPVLNNSVDDFAIENAQRGPALVERKKKSEQLNSCTLDRGSLKSDDNSSYYSMHSKRLNQISNSSDTSSDEFESLVERIKSKTQRTPAATSSNMNGKRMAITEPVKQKTISKIQGIKHKPEEKSFVPVFIQPTKPKKHVLSDSTSTNQVPNFNFSDLSESQSQCRVWRKCKTPGCFLQDLTLSSSKYVRNFKRNREELTQELYNLYNKTIFQQKLPEKMEIAWNKKMRKTAGYCVTGQKRDDVLQRYARIELSEKVCDSAERLRDTLIHELCHAATWLINNVRDGHGPIWKLYAQKSILIHPELPMVKRCHTYEINYKYTYQCSRCKNMIGRHSKSLDTQRFVCAICKGPLELLSNSMKYSTPAKRELAPFAKFVKENYSSTKKENEGLKHAEVMRKLSVDFGKKAQISDL